MLAVRPSFFVVGMGLPVALLAPAHASAQQIQFDQLRGMVPADADRSRCCVVLDADRDSDLDLLLVNGSVTPRLYLNDGQGTFADGTEGAFSGPSGFSMSCAAGDVDGDGILDLVFANAYSSNSLFLGDGRGRFVDGTTGRLPSDLDATQAVALGDLDGDGDLDIVWGNGEDWVRRQQNRIYLNLGRGVFADATPGSLPVWGDATLGIALGDLDRDGDLDLLFANDGRNRLLLNDGAAVFSDVTIANLPPDAETSFSISLGDVDADGDLDAMVGNGRWTPEPSRLYLNDGFARFSDATAALLDAPPGLCRATLLADLDGDGDLDGWLGNFGQDLALGNDGHGRLSPAGFPDPPPDPADTPWVANGDVDGDGDLDLILARFGQTRLLLNRGDGAFTDVTLPDLPADSGWGQSCLLHDLDDDGYPDLVVGNDGQDRLYRNQEGGGFADVTHLSYPRDEVTTSAMAVGDVDGDGDPDLLLGSRDSRTRLYRNDGRLRFEDVTAAQVPPDGDYCNGVALGDVDLDGDLDAILANFGQSRIYVNDGSGTFAERPWLPSSYESVLSLATGDFDRDGDLDILLGTMAGEPCILLLNDGSGRYSDASAGRIPPNLSAVDGIAAGDVDGDGDLDAMLAGYDFHVGSRSVSLFENDGAGRFTDVTASLVPPISGLLKRPVLADLDLDGDLDAAIGGFLERILRNDGGRGFADVSEEALPLASFGTSEFAVGDIDGDGDLDLALAAVNGLQDRILFNLHLQLSYLSVPRVGRRLEMELAGPPGGTWRLAACRNRVEIPIPPYGTLRVDPGTAILRRAGMFPADGKAVIPFLVPPAATLVGRSLYWQALIGPPQRLSNLEVTTFTNL